MIVASGFVEVEGLIHVENVVNEIQKRGFEVNEIEKVKIVFLIESDTVESVKSEIEALKGIDAVRTVHLAYYSLEGNDEAPGIKHSESGNV